MRWKSNCRFFLGVKPCKYKRICRECVNYQPWKEKCLIIKLAAKGDVIRTTPLALALKQYNHNLKISWLTDNDAAPLLSNNPSVDEILCFNAGSLTQLSAERFDRIICLDKEPRAAALASILEGDRKTGFGWDPKGYLIPLGKDSELIYDLGLSDELKFRTNQKSYQQLIIESAGLKYTGQKYQYLPTEAEKEWAAEFLYRRLKLKNSEILIGLNTGVGRAFPTKAWPREHFMTLAKGIMGKKLGRAVLLGGPDEKELIDGIAKRVPGIVKIPADLEVRQFAAMLSLIEIIVSADSLAMHLGIALNRKVIAMFGPTCQQEIGLYGRGEKLMAETECSPCYRQLCPNNRCMSGISPDVVLGAIKRNIGP
jgi:heptosyltransferase-2